MLVWRIARAPFADLSGEGARRFGARWNSPGQAMLYTADDAALALLEVRVHLDVDRTLMPADYVLMKIEVPDDIDIETMPDLPLDPVAAGDLWLDEARTALLRVPSFIIPESTNLLINPAHPEARRIRDFTIRDFQFDDRLWLPR